MQELTLIISVLVTVFGISAFVCGALIYLSRLQPGWYLRTGDRAAIQCAHVAPTPRIGGVAILAGIIATVALAPGELTQPYLVFSLTLLPVLALGLSEDLGWRVRPLWRLMGAAVASLAVMVSLGFWVERADLPGLDPLIAYAPVGILVTLFFAVGICHSVNLLDGLNGLASGAAILIALGLVAVSYKAGEIAVMRFNLMLVAVIGGFFVFNYPFGKIFLGDGGAYALGHVLVWSAIALIYRVESIAPPALALIFFWPMADTCLAMFRRRRNGRPVGAPDRLHYHQLVMRALEIHVFGRGRRNITNPVATALMLPLIAAPVLTGVVLMERPVAALAAIIAFAVLFFGSYVIGVRLAARRRPRTAGEYARGAPEMPHNTQEPIQAKAARHPEGERIDFGRRLSTAGRDAP